jgi:hypothetical protein
MRKLALVAALALAGAAYADEKLGTTGQETKEAGQAAARDAKAGASDAKASAETQAQRADQPAEQGSTAQRGEAARDQLKKDDFSIEGKVAKVSKNQLTLSREEAPAATLHCDKTTKVEVDGKVATLQQLKPGQEVKASFNLKGDKPHAIEVKAEKD